MDHWNTEKVENVDWQEAASADAPARCFESASRAFEASAKIKSTGWRKLAVSRPAFEEEIETSTRTTFP